VSKASRDKGARGEREFREFVSSRLEGVELSRNYDQWYKGGFDLTGLDGVAIEVKRYATGTIFRMVWWEQILEACGELVPVLAYRFDRGSWMCVVPLDWMLGLDGGNARERFAVMPAEDWVERYATWRESACKARGEV
jgi:hypothetical protein